MPVLFSVRASNAAIPDAQSWPWAALQRGVEQVAAELRRRVDHAVYHAQQTAIRLPLATTRALARMFVGVFSTAWFGVRGHRQRLDPFARTSGEVGPEPVLDMLWRPHGTTFQPDALRACSRNVFGSTAHSHGSAATNCTAVRIRQGMS